MRQWGQVRGGIRGAGEWIGGPLVAPFFVTDREDPYRPTVTVWMELPAGLVLAQNVSDPDDSAGALGRALRAALETPMVGPPRRPAEIRVADADLAAEVRAVIGEEIPVRIAPTPELDELFAAMLAALSEKDAEDAGSYLEGGRVPVASAAELFATAKLLYDVAPWRTTADGQVLRMDIPALGVEGACVSIIGNLGESFGFVIFPTLAGFEAFGEAGEDLMTGREPADLGTGFLVLTFERAADLPPTMRREAAAHGWPVAKASAYPLLKRVERDGLVRPLVDRDIRTAAACAAALAAFFAKHGSLSDEDEIEPLCESYFDDDDLEVRFTYPYDALSFFEVEEPAARDPSRNRSERPRVSRNAPCPCGSGRKYKKCCLGRDEADRRRETQRAAAHDLDGRWVRELSGFALVRFGRDARRFTRHFQDAAEVPSLAIPWSVYGFHVEGRTVVDWYLEEHGRRLAREDRAWLEAQRAAWLSVWEVVEVEPGERFGSTTCFPARRAWCARRARPRRWSRGTRSWDA